MALNLECIRAICFDVDGTLSDTDDQLIAKLEKWLSPLCLLCPAEKLNNLARRLVIVLENPVNVIYQLADKVGLDNYFAHIYSKISRGEKRRRARHTFLLITGVREMLVKLKGKYKIAIVSARGEKSTREFLKAFNLEEFFNVVVTAHTCYYTKPFPDPVLYAAKMMGVGAGECLMVGDTVLDIKAGKRAGSQTVGVLCGFGVKRELQRAGAGLILNSTPEIVKVILPQRNR